MKDKNGNRAKGGRMEQMEETEKGKEIEQREGE